MNNFQNNGKSFELQQVLILFIYKVYSNKKYIYFQIGSQNSSKSMPQQGGIRSYQVVNDGTDDQFVCK